MAITGRGAREFEDLEVWKESRIVVREIYERFGRIRDWDFRSQIQRAAVSVMNNIAEGFERRTRKDFAHFLDQAKGSAGEVRSLLYVGQDLLYIGVNEAETLRSRLKILSRMIAALAQRLRDEPEAHSASRA